MGMADEMNLTTDHQQIRRWAESAGGRPVQVHIAHTEVTVPHLDFDGRSAGRNIQVIAWSDWFEMFDQAGLALLYEQPADGSRSTFSKLVQRDPAG